MGWAKRCCAAPATALQRIPAQGISVKCPQPGTGVGEMVEAKIVGKNKNNIRLGRISKASGSGGKGGDHAIDFLIWQVRCLM